MTKVIGVRFRQAGRIYNFAVGDIEVENEPACNSRDCKRNRIW